VAESFKNKWADASSMQDLQRRLLRLAPEATKAVRDSNRTSAKALATIIKGEMPRTGGIVVHRHPSSRATGPSRKHKSGRGKTRAGAMANSVQARAGAGFASVVGGGKPRYPHFIVNEFGGTVKWKKGTHSHSIPVRKRSPSLASLGFKGGGAAGYFFYPTAKENLPTIQKAATKAAAAAVFTAVRTPQV
jgi:hypothetical protein